MIVANRSFLLNGNSFILSVPGSGKSFTGKNEIVNLMLAGDADIIVIDPECEYSRLVEAMGGATIKISATSNNHINAMVIAYFGIFFGAEDTGTGITLQAVIDEIVNAEFIYT